MPLCVFVHIRIYHNFDNLHCGLSMCKLYNMSRMCSVIANDIKLTSNKINKFHIA